MRGIYNRLVVFWHSMFGTFADMDYNKRRLQVYKGIRFNSCIKEPEVVRWIETFKKDDVFYDIGACIGAYSLIGSLYAKDVFAFEPAFFNYNLLLKNITHNIKKGYIENNITPVYNALSVKTGICVFNYSRLEDGSALHVLDGIIDYKGDPFEPVYSQDMLSLSLDDFISIYKCPIPNHIKIDVDGNEYEILQGMPVTLSKPSLRSIMVEMHPSDAEIEMLLVGYGFALYEKTIRSEHVSNCHFRRDPA